MSEQMLKNPCYTVNSGSSARTIAPDDGLLPQHHFAKSVVSTTYPQILFSSKSGL